MNWSYLSDKGLKRANNEDSLACEVIGGVLCMVIADGLGGQEKGEVASRIATDSIIDILREEEDLLKTFDEGKFDEMLTNAFRKANSKILLQAAYDRSCIGMSTTLTLALLTPRRLVIAHVGDCRAYLLHGSKMEILTNDHTYAAELMQKPELKTSEEDLSRARNLLTNYLGENRFITPDIYRYNVRYGDVIMLCSDGVYAYVDAERIRHILRRHGDLDACLLEMKDEVFRNGAGDNLSMIVALNKPDEKKEQ